MSTTFRKYEKIFYLIDFLYKLCYNVIQGGDHIEEKLIKEGWDKAEIICLNTHNPFPYRLLLLMLLAWEKEVDIIDIGRNVLLISQGDFHINFIKGGEVDDITHN